MKLGGDDREEAQTAAKGATRTPLRSLACHPTTRTPPPRCRHATRQTNGPTLGVGLTLGAHTRLCLTLGAHISVKHWGHTSWPYIRGTRLGLTLGAHTRLGLTLGAHTRLGLTLGAHTRLGLTLMAHVSALH